MRLFSYRRKDNYVQKNMHVIEKELIEKVKMGNENSFNTLFYQYHGRVYNLCRKFLFSKEDAEEVVQTVFLAIWENRSQLDEEKPIIAYILVISKHCIYNFLRKSVYKKAYLEYLATKDEALEFVTEEDIYYNDLQVILEQLMSKMPPKRKQIFQLCKLEGLSYREIAVQLSITESTVNTQISKALEFIRKHIEILY